MLRRLLIASTAVAFVAVPAFAQETMRVRGTVEKVDGSTLTIKSRDGTDVKIAVAGDKPTYTALEKASLADIKPNSYIGVTSLAQADGSLKAVAVHIFAEAARGGEIRGATGNDAFVALSLAAQLSESAALPQQVR